MTTDNNLPRVPRPEPGTGAELGPSGLLRPPSLPGAMPTITGERSILILQEEVLDLAEGVRRAAKRGTDTASYKKAKARYEAALGKLNRERSKIQLPPIKSAEELEELSDVTGTSDIRVLENALRAEQELGNTKKAQEIEAQIAEAQAIRSSNRITPGGVRAASQTGIAGYVPDLKNGRPILNPEDFTITVVDQNNNPIVVNDKPLMEVFLVFEDKNFYERGVKTTIKNIAYRNAEDIRSLAFSLGKNDRKKLQEEFKKLNLLPSNYNANGELDRDGAFENAFISAHAFANRVNFQRLQNNQPIVGLSEAIKEYKAEEEGDAGPRTVTAKGFFSLSEGESKILLDDYYKNTLGRNATPDELKQFQNVVKRRAERKPSVTQKTYTDGALTEERTLEPGFGEAEARLTAFRQAKARPEFEAYQLATTYYDAILGAAQSPINIQRPTS